MEDLGRVGGSEFFGGQFLDTPVASNPFSTSSVNANTLATACLLVPSASAADINFAGAYYLVPYHVKQSRVSVFDHASTTSPFDGASATLGLVSDPSPGLAWVAQSGPAFQQAPLDTEQGPGAYIHLDPLPSRNDEVVNWAQEAGIFGSLSGSPSSNEPATIPRPTPELTSTKTSSPATWRSGSSPPTVAPGSAESNTVGWYWCHECLKKCATKRGYRRHVKNCHEKKHQCPYPGCEMRFGPRAELKRHLNTVRHGGTREFICPQCGKELSRKDFLRRHLRGVHGVDLPKGRGGNLGSTIMGG